MITDIPPLTSLPLDQRPLPGAKGPTRDSLDLGQADQEGPRAPRTVVSPIPAQAMTRLGAKWSPPSEWDPLVAFGAGNTGRLGGNRPTAIFDNVLHRSAVRFVENPYLRSSRAQKGPRATGCSRQPSSPFSERTYVLRQNGAENVSFQPR